MDERNYPRVAGEPSSPPTRGVVAFLSESNRAGGWELPAYIRVASVLGSAKLDLREAVIQPGTSVIEVMAVLGNVEIIVPPWLRVRCDGDALGGTFVLSHSKGRSYPEVPVLPDAPLIQVIGRAYLGEVKVQIRDTDEGMMQRIKRTMDGNW